MGRTIDREIAEIVSGIGEMALEPQFGRGMRKYFQFDEGWVNLNHGSFGTYPLAVRRALTAFQTAAESRTDEFIFTDQLQHLIASRTAVANLLNVPVDETVFVPNATTGVNTVLRSLMFEQGDVIVYFNFIYDSCGKTVSYLEESTPVVGVKVPVTFPMSNDEIVGVFKEAVLKEQKEGKRVRLAIFDTIVSMPGVRLPFERLAKECKELGVLSLVDGAHGVGNIKLDLKALDADFFISNCHKWLFAPRGCAVLHVPLRNQPLIRSTIPTSSGFLPTGTPNPSPGTNPFVAMFEWYGTIDFSPTLCVPAAIKFRETVCGGEDRILEYVQGLAKSGAEKIAEILGTEVLAREGEGCSMYNVRLPISVAGAAAREGEVQVEEAHLGAIRPYITKTLCDEFNTHIPVMLYNGAIWARVSGQVYLELQDFKDAAEWLLEISERVRRREFLKVGQ